jgi:thiol-disulfide isomerase/thioredoxin
VRVFNKHFCFVVIFTILGVNQVKSECLPARDFQLRDQSGDLVSLQKIVKSSKNNIILISVFQTTCAPCINEIKYLLDLKQKNEKLGLSNFDLVLIDSKEERSQTFDFLRKNNFKIDTVLNDPNGKLDSLYKISSIPKLIIVDNKANLLTTKDGRELYSLRESGELEKIIMKMAKLESCKYLGGDEIN